MSPTHDQTTHDQTTHDETSQHDHEEDQMTTQPEQTTTQPADDHEPEHTHDEPQDSPELDERNPGREAAKYRRALREVEAERDHLLTVVDTMRRAEIEREASKVLRNPAGLWAAQVAVENMLDDNGNVDPGKVADAARYAADALGLQRNGAFSPLEGRYPTTQPGGRRGTDAMADVIMGR